MIGAIIGDVTGSSYEFDNNTEDYDLDLFREGTTFTDDTVCTIAVADAILHHKSYESALLEWCGKYPGRGYGGRFQMWLTSAVHRPYGSYGNGSAMRVSPVGWAFGDLGTTLAEAERTALPTHNHPEGIKGAQVVAEAIFRLRRGEWDKIQDLLISSYGADYERQLPCVGVFDETCQGCVPLSLLILTKSTDFEDSIRSAIHYGGDSDTLAAIVGSMAEAYFGVPDPLAERALSYLPQDMREIYEEFRDRFTPPSSLEV